MRGSHSFAQISLKLLAVFVLSLLNAEINYAQLAINFVFLINRLLVG